MFEQLLNNMNSALNESKKPVKEEMDRAIFNRIESLVDQEELDTFKSSVSSLASDLFADGFDESDVDEYITKTASAEILATLDVFTVEDDNDANESKKPVKEEMNRTVFDKMEAAVDAEEFQNMKELISSVAGGFVVDGFSADEIQEFLHNVVNVEIEAVADTIANESKKSTKSAKMNERVSLKKKSK